MKLTRKQEKAIAKAIFGNITTYVSLMPFEKQVKIVSSLNGCGREWPDNLPNKPPWFGKLSAEMQISLMRSLYHEVEHLVPEKAVLRYEHVVLQGRKEQDFEDWWEQKKSQKEKTNVISIVTYWLLIGSVLLFAATGLIELFR